MIKCLKCNTEKPEEDFRWKSKKLEKRYPYCRLCHNAYERTLKHSTPEHLEKRLKSYLNRKRKIGLPIQQKIIEYLLEHPCVDCGFSNPLGLQFDHMRDKSFQISDYYYKPNAWESIELEIQKCEVRCANCHQMKTHISQNSMRYFFTSTNELDRLKKLLQDC